MQRADRLPSLDGIRALSLVCVLIDHFSMGLGYGDRLNLGGLGVRVFFVLSGFLITGLLLKELETTGEISLARFYFRRTMRIFPPYYFYIAVMVALGAMGITSVTVRAAIPAFFYVSNYAAASEVGRFTFGHAWSLSTEEQFYLLWPAILVVFGRRRALWLLLITLAAMPAARTYLWAAGRSMAEVSHVLHLNTDHLATGCLLAFLSRRLHRSERYLRVAGSKWMVLAPVAAFALNVPSKFTGFQETISFSILNVLIALSLDAAILNAGSAVGRFLNWKPVAMVGVMSYSIYLWHQPFSGLGRDFATFARYPVMRNPAVAFAAALACSAFSYYFVERYAMSLRRAISPRLSWIHQRAYRGLMGA